MARLRRRGRPSYASGAVFLPDHLDQVRAVAMRGLTDDEMAGVFGISSDLLASWRAFYPEFNKAIEEGRTVADRNVVAALYTAATGLDGQGQRVRLRKQKTVRVGDKDFHEYEVVELEEDLPPDVQAQRYWLDNRQPAHWGTKLQIGGDRSPGAKPLGVGLRDETKSEIIASILNLIKPKPDPA